MSNKNTLQIGGLHKSQGRHGSIDTEDLDIKVTAEKEDDGTILFKVTKSGPRCSVGSWWTITEAKSLIAQLSKELSDLEIKQW